ncbi:MAG: iron chelate uptake ABC transporter family permease subunit [Chloroflexota bacterium]
MRNRRHAWLIIGVLGAVLVGSVLLAVALGAVRVEPLAILEMGLNKLGLSQFQPFWRPADETIVMQIRLPRVIGAALVGSALGTAGVLFQGLLRNPMADPYIIGTSAGAALGAAVAMMVPLSVKFYGFGLVPIVAFLGALGAVAAVYNLARVAGKTPVISMLLAGFAVSALLMAIMSFLIFMGGELETRLHQVFAFLLGGIAVTHWEQLAVISPILLGAIVFARLFAFRLNAFALGEEGAAYLGLNVERDKVLILSSGSLLTACAVSLSGLIGFVGLVVPHAVRLVLGPDHRLLLPVSGVVGAAFLVLADLAARTVLAPTELPVGVLTALIGAPFFIYLLRRTRGQYAF